MPAGKIKGVLQQYNLLRALKLTDIGKIRYPSALHVLLRAMKM